jgi:hypothetical protein
MTGKWLSPNVPQSGWECVDVQDLGSPIATCQMCEKETIRYAHYMCHPNYQGTLMVGCVCAGRMEGNLQSAKERDAFMKSRMNKRKNWLDRKWKISRSGNQYIKSDGFIVVMKDNKDGLWSAFVKSESGDFEQWSSRKYKNEKEMKLAAFDCLTKVLAEKKYPQQAESPSPNVPLLPTKPSEHVNANHIPTVPKSLFDDPHITDVEIIEDDKIVDISYVERDFTNEQKYIFEFVKNGTEHGIIDAVAGAGKTTTIMECAKYVDDPTDILFCAFNKSIQVEIANKFNQQGLHQVTVKTIHALGFQILKDNNSTGNNFTPHDTKYWTILNKDINVHREIQLYVEELLRLNGYESSEIENNRQFAVKDIIYKFKDKLLEINQKIRVTLTPYSMDDFKNMVEHYHIFSEIEAAAKHFDKELEIYFECTEILLRAGNKLAQEALIIDYTDMLYLPYIWDLRASKHYSFLFIDELKKIFKQEERALVIDEIPDNFENIKQTVFNRWLFIIGKEAENLRSASEREIYIQTKTEYLNNKLEFMHKKYLQWKNSCKTINDMLIKIKDFITATDNCIKLSTIHRAKGLEAKRVFILNFDDLPHLKPNQKYWEKIQEQNLKYVAITRALNDLYLVKSDKIETIRKEASLFDEFIIKKEFDINRK